MLMQLKHIVLVLHPIHRIYTQTCRRRVAVGWRRHYSSCTPLVTLRAKALRKCASASSKYCKTHGQTKRNIHVWLVYTNSSFLRWINVFLGLLLFRDQLLLASLANIAYRLLHRPSINAFGHVLSTSSNTSELKAALRPQTVGSLARFVGWWCGGFHYATFCRSVRPLSIVQRDVSWGDSVGSFHVRVR